MCGAIRPSAGSSQALPLVHITLDPTTCEAPELSAYYIVPIQASGAPGVIAFMRTRAS